MAELRVYLCALSNPVRSRIHYEDLIPDFERAGITLEISGLLDRDVPPAAKAEDFNKALRSGRYAWIADVSGGDLANLVLPYLDYEAYQEGTAYYAGFSDCTCIVNALAVQARKKALLFPLWNQTDFSRAIRIFKGRNFLPSLQPVMGCEFWPRHARISGGNMRCFLKLAGTVYMPWVSGSLLVLESMSADWNSFRSMAAHLRQCGGFDGIRGIILGRFNRIEEQFGNRLEAAEKMIRYLRPLCPENIGWYLAENLGHIPDSEGIWISVQPSRAEVLSGQARTRERMLLLGKENGAAPQGGPWNTAVNTEKMPGIPQGVRVYQPEAHTPGPLPSAMPEKKAAPAAAPASMRHAPEREEEEFEDDSLFDFDPDMTAELLIRQWSQEEETNAAAGNAENAGSLKKGGSR